MLDTMISVLEPNNDSMTTALDISMEFKTKYKSYFNYTYVMVDKEIYLKKYSKILIYNY